MSTTATEVVPAELIGHDGSYPIRLRLTVEELWSNESDSPIGRTVVKVEPLTLSGVKDGSYTMHFFFDGRQEVQRVRIEWGFMLVG